MIEKEKYFPRLLTISINAWSETKSTGIFFTSHFGDWHQEKIANIYLRSEDIDNKSCLRYFRIAETDILKSMLSGKSLGIEILHNNLDINKYKSDYRIKNKPVKVIELIKRIRPTSVLFLREIFWAVGFKRKEKLDMFLKDFKPDVIHLFCPGLIYGHRVLHYCQKLTNAKVVLFFGDEIYTYKSFWPLERLYQFILRGWIRKTINIADLNYAATPELSEFYSQIFGKEFKLFYKGAKMIHPVSKDHKLPLKIVYAGNILWDRWKTLALIAKAINEVSDDKQLFKLEIYTNNALSKEMQLALNTAHSEVKKAVPYEEVKSILSDADLVLHVEGFAKKYINITKYSFSTKIVDCIQSGSCVMAVGPNELASINFLKQSEAAIVANNYDEICKNLQKIIADKETLDFLPRLMNIYVKDKFELSIIRENLYKDFIKILD